jgi:tRNA modification GTPase
MPTIVAIATAPINCAIHIIRVSGTKAYEIVNKITDTNVTKSSYTIQRANIVDKKKFVDDVLLMKFVSPKSFTGEDLIEINCHGGIYLANKIINLLIKNGAKLALPGDFSRRAFLNKKINLNQAEAINNLINTNSDIGIAVAHQGLSPHLNKQFKQITAELFQVLGKLEVSIDYPEYDDAKLSTNKLIIKKLIPLQQFLQKCIDVSTHSLKFLKGINLAIVGKPNVGKSSLLNALVNEDRAIISAIPGTTRDTIDASFKIDNLTFNVIDTAGIRLKTNDLIEKAGMSKTETIVKKADMII